MTYNQVDRIAYIKTHPSSEIEPIPGKETKEARGTSPEHAERRFHSFVSREPEEVGLKLVTLGDIHRMEVEYPPPVIDGLLEERDSLIVTGQAGVGKSLFALEVATAVAAGIPLFGQFHVPRPRPVLLLQAENSLKATRERLHEIVGMETLAGRGALYRESLERVHTTMIGEDCRMTTGDLGNEKFLEELKDMLQRTGAELLILDPLISFHQQDENSNVAMRKVLDLLTAVTSAAPAAVLLIHHHGKGQYQGADQSRGATAIKDWARGILTLNKEGPAHRRQVRCEHTKHSNFDKAKTVWLQVNGPRICPVELDTACPPSRVKETLQGMGGEAPSKNKLTEALELAHDISRATAQKAINQAVEAGAVDMSKNGRNCVYRLPSA